jgi:hypothetical protein
MMRATRAGGDDGRSEPWPPGPVLSHWRNRPAAVGEDMRTLRLSLVGTVLLMLLGGLSGAVVAQEADGNTHVTGRVVCDEAPGRTVQEDDGLELHLFHGECTATMSDPRLSGPGVYDSQQLCLKEDAGQVCLGWGTFETTGPDGTWVGTFGWVEDPSGTSQPEWGFSEGTGAYEGWTYWFHNPDLMDPSSVESGILYQGPPPPWGETLPLAPAE